MGKETGRPFKNLKKGPGEVPDTSLNSKRNQRRFPWSGTRKESSESPSRKPPIFTPENAVYFHPGNRAKDTTPDTFNRGIPPAEHQAHLASIRLTSGEVTSPGIHEIQTEIAKNPPQSFMNILSELATAVVETDYKKRGLDVHNRKRMRADTQEVPQALLHQLVDASNAVAGPVDPIQGGRELTWTERQFLPKQTPEEKAFNEIVSAIHHSVEVQTWPHETQWGIHQHQVPEITYIERSSFLGIHRTPLASHTYREVDSPLSEYPVNQTLTDEQSYALWALNPEETAKDLVARDRHVARVQLSIPPFTIATMYGQPVDKSYEATGGITYQIFEDYDGKLSIARIDKTREPYNVGYSDGNSREYYRPTQREVRALTKALLQFSWLDTH